MSDFVHFNVHTDYSLFHSTIKLDDLIKKTDELGFKAIAVTELDNMFSAMEFYKKAENFKPIIGIDTCIDNEKFRLKLIAKNNTGYKNLMYLSSMPYIYDKDNHPVITYNELIKHKDGIVVIISYLKSEIGNFLQLYKQKNNKKFLNDAEKLLQKYKKDFDEIYFEIRRDFEDDNIIEKEIINLSKKYNIPLLATSNVFHLEKEDCAYSTILDSIRENEKHFSKKSYLKSKEEMLNLFKDLPEALYNTSKLADSIKLDLNFDTLTPPKFKFLKEYISYEKLNLKSENEYFAYKCREGLKKRLKCVPKEKHQQYINRLEYEIDYIQKRNFSGYFLIVWDYIKEAKSREIQVGPARGNAGGSLAAFALEITDVDPIKYNLIFEKFINPEINIPDIDIDIAWNRKDEIIQYIKNKYGKFNTADIITFGRFTPSTALQHAAKVLNIDNSYAQKLIDLIPLQIGITLQTAYEMEDELRNLIETEDIYKKLFEIALKLEGLISNTDILQAVIVIDNEYLWNKTPLFKKNNKFITQYSIEYLENAGVIKYDLLALQTLSLIENTLSLIKQKYNVNINFSEMELNDKKVFELISNGDTDKIFQFEFEGMKNFAKKLKPENFENIIALLSLYRPGPIQVGLLDEYIERKNGKSPVDYFFDEFKDELKPILQSTYGLIIYQEQIIQILHKIGGFNLFEADKVRKALGKKKYNSIKKFKEIFANNAEKKGFNKDKAYEFFSILLEYAGFAFTKAHATAYAMITYQTAYLKTYYRNEFCKILKD